LTFNIIEDFKNDIQERGIDIKLSYEPFNHHLLEEADKGIEPEILPRLFTKFVPKSELGEPDWVCLFQKHYRISWWLNMGQE
jgi:hypothetical protein